jgi:hypothetical protein
VKTAIVFGDEFVNRLPVSQKVGVSAPGLATPPRSDDDVGWRVQPQRCGARGMSAGEALVVIGVSLVITAVMIMQMTRLDGISRQRSERRRAAWKATGTVGPHPQDRFPEAGNLGPFSRH